MIQYLPLILVCNSLSSPASCNENNKDITVTRGKPQLTPMGCLIDGQTTAAQLAFSPKIGDTYYVKIRCLAKEIKELNR